MDVEGKPHMKRFTWLQIEEEMYPWDNIDEFFGDSLVKVVILIRERFSEDRKVINRQGWR